MMLIKKYLIVLLCISSLGFSFVTISNTKIYFKDGTKITYLKTFSSGDKDIITKEFKSQSATKKTIEVNISRQENTPYVFDYAYTLIDNKDNYQLDMKGVMDPMNLYVADNINLTYWGDKITYPKSLPIEQQLPDLSGILTRSVENIVKGEVAILIKNRKALNEENLVVNSKTYKATIFTYTIIETNIYDKTPITVSTSTVKEWYVPTYGVLKKEVSQVLEDKTVTEGQLVLSYTLIATKIEN
jgi:hypothetical protein